MIEYYLLYSLRQMDGSYMKKYMYNDINHINIIGHELVNMWPNHPASMLFFKRLL